MKIISRPIKVDNVDLSNRTININKLIYFIENNDINYGSIINLELETICTTGFTFMNEIRNILKSDINKFIHIKKTSMMIYTSRFMFEWFIDEDGLMVELSDDIFIELLTLCLDISILYDKSIVSNIGTVSGNAIRMRPYIGQIDRLLEKLL